jgi:hypothetical protein
VGERPLPADVTAVAIGLFAREEAALMKQLAERDDAQRCRARDEVVG